MAKARGWAPVMIQRDTKSGRGELERDNNAAYQRSKANVFIDEGHKH